MKKYIFPGHRLMVVLLFLFSFSCGTETEKATVTAEEATKEIVLPRSAPEKQGISSETILTLLDSIEASEIEFHSIMILRHDTVIAEGWWEPYQKGDIHTLYSLSKSFTSTAVGFAVQEGLLTVEDKVVSFFPEDLPDSVDEQLADMEIRDLLTMSSGHESGTMPGMAAREDGDWVKGFLSQPLTYEPGEHFFYNTGATFMLSAILQKITGETVLEYLTPRLFEPLGIEGMDWEENPQGINTGGYGLRVRTEDIAKLGLLYLHKGKFNGEQLLSESWVEEATGARISSYDGDSDWAQGYGYQFWRCKPENAYRGDGAFGQYCIVLPDQDMVIAITSESKDMQKSMDLLWDNLLPGVEEGSLPGNPEALAALQEKVENLSVHSESLRNASEAPSRTIALAENDLGINVIEVDPAAQKFIIYGLDTISMNFGWSSWVVNDTRTSIPLGADVDSRMAIRAGWNGDNQLVIQRQFIETAHHDQFSITGYESEEPQVTWSESVSLWTEGNEGREIPLTP